MKLEGVHHVTAITGDAPQNVEFYAGTLGLRLVKKTVNQDDPTVYHLFYADEQGSAGRRHHVLRVPRRAAAAARARAWCTPSSSGSARRTRSTFWEERLGAAGVTSERDDGRLRFADPEGLALELAVVDDPGRAARRRAPGDPARARDPGLRRRARVRGRARGEPALPRAGARLRAARRGLGGRAASSGAASTPTTAPPPERGFGGAGTVHHVAWATTMDEHEAWRERVAQAGAHADARDRPLLLPLDLLPRAERRAVRARHDRARASRPTSRPTRSASGSRSRPRSSTCASGSSRALTPLPEPARGPRHAVSLVHRTRPAAGEPEGAARALPRPRRRRARPLPVLDLLDPERRLLGVTPARAALAAARRRALVRARRAGDARPGRRSCRPTARPRAGSTTSPAETGIPPEKTVLGGFSQGAVMTYALGLGTGPPATRGAARAQRLHPDGAGLRARPDAAVARRSRSATAPTTRSSASSGAGARRRCSRRREPSRSTASTRCRTRSSRASSSSCDPGLPTRCQ